MDYSSLGMRREIEQAMEQMGFTELTEVQEKTIPLMLAGKDIVAQAPTGTGKTCAFGVPMIQHINPEDKRPQALVLCPTRELCLQIAEEIGRLTAFLPEIKTIAIYGGSDIERQIRRLKEGVQIVIATPGRMQDHMEHRTIDVRGIETIILDEADEMLDMGFYDDVMRIIGHIPAKKHLHMFSATISSQVMNISWKYQKDPEEIVVAPVEESMPKIDQYSLLTTGRNKLADMADIMVSCGYNRAIIFCNTKYGTEALCNQLIRLNFKAECLNGDMPQGERNKIMGRFRSGDIDVLVATDVAARGIDVSDVQVVFNYDLPQTNDYYLHRIGRTGRAKKEGVSFLLYTADEKKRVREIIHTTQSDVKEVRISFGKLKEVIPNPWSEGGIRIMYSN